MSIHYPVETEKVLMVVKTYPTPSSRHGELTCTAGIRLRDNRWIRIYPYPFRLISKDYRFKKYDILEIQIQKTKGDDPRPDSYRLFDTDSIKVVENLKGWPQRLPLIRKTAVASVAEFMADMLTEDKQAWGPSILPVPVTSRAKLSSEYQGAEWPEEDLKKLKRAEQRLETGLFVDQDVVKFFRQLKRPPYKFRLTFTDLTGAEYTFPILDWEIAQLYFNARTRAQSDDEALEVIQERIKA